MLRIIATFALSLIAVLMIAGEITNAFKLAGHRNLALFAAVGVSLVGTLFAVWNAARSIEGLQEEKNARKARA